VSTNTLDTSITIGIVLTSSGSYTSPFTITTAGTIDTAGAVGVFSDLSTPSLMNQGLVTAGTYGVEFDGDGIVFNDGTAAVISGADGGVLSEGAANTIINDGTISGAGSLGFGIDLISAGYILNSGAAAEIFDGDVGIRLLMDGTVVNSGIISGGEGIAASNAANTILNAGTISGTAGPGIQLAGGYVLNSGTAAVIAGGDVNGAGVFVGGRVSTIVNNGTISGGFFGVEFGSTQGGTIINDGTISGTGTSGTGIGLGDGGGYILNSGTAAVIAGAGENDGGLNLVSPGGTVVNDGTIIGTGPGSLTNGIRMEGGTIVNALQSAEISGSHFGIFAVGETAATIVNAGTIYGGTLAVDFDGAGNDLLIVDPGAVFIGAVESTTATNVLELAAGDGALGTLASIGSQFNGFSTVDFDSGAKWRIEGNLTGLAGAETINGFGMGDTIILDGFAETSYAYGSHGLVLQNNTGSATLDITGNFSTGSFDVQSDSGDTMIILCFYPGTRIATPAGEVAVEALRPGDLVNTANGAKPVRWVGESPVSTKFADPLQVLPVRIRAGALGEGLPVRDLLVSPDHAIFIAGILAQAGALVNGQTILREAAVPEQFTFYHVELDTHEFLFAEGVMAESFVDNLDRMYFSNFDARERPDQPIVEMPFPRAKSFRQLPRAIRTMLAARCGTEIVLETA
jgi:hypothetical protein